MTAFPPYPGTASACAASVIGIKGHLTHAGATACDGPLGLRITGLPETAVRETRDRVYAAVAFPVKSACRTEERRLPRPLDLVPYGSSEITDASQQEARVLQRIADLGIAAPSSGYSPVIENERAESATGATAAMLRSVLPASVPGQFVYRTYSAVTHGEIYGLMNFMAPGVTSDGSKLLHWHLPPEVLDSTIQLAIAAFREAYRRINKVMGWGKLKGDLWEIKLRKIYNS
jgi:hypothetical protein